MAPDASQSITRLMHRGAGGDRAARESFVERAYLSLQAIAEAQMRTERVDHTLDSTALVHEAMLRLLGDDHHKWDNRRAFFAYAARVMRSVLIDHARARSRQKRGGDRRRVDFAVLLDRYDEQPLDPATLLDLDQALTRLEASVPRAARVLELRLFVGLTTRETADVLELGTTSVEEAQKAGLAFLRAWLDSEADSPRA